MTESLPFFHLFSFWDGAFRKKMCLKGFFPTFYYEKFSEKFLKEIYSKHAYVYHHLDFKIISCWFLNKDDSTILFLLASVQLEAVPHTDINCLRSESPWIFAGSLHSPSEWVNVEAVLTKVFPGLSLSSSSCFPPPQTLLSAVFFSSVPALERGWLWSCRGRALS